MRDFWRRLQTGVAVAVGGATPDTLLGVRDGFLRYFRDGLHREVSIAVVPHEGSADPHGLAVSDEEALLRAQARVAELEARLGDAYHFYTATEGALHSLEVEGRGHTFIRSWTVLRSVLGEAWGSSGSVELPERIIAGVESEHIPAAMPGTLRSGGMISSLTGGLENRRTATAVSTLHCLASLFYGFLESKAGRRRG